MGLFSSLLGTRRESPLNVRKAIIAYCTGNLVELAFANSNAFISTYRENPTNVLKARLYSAAMMRLGIQLDQNGIPDIDAKFYSIDNQYSLLRFNFKEYGGVFELQPNTPMIAPSFVAIVYFNDFFGDPAIFMLEPTFEVGATMLIRIMPDGLRVNLGHGTGNDEQSFLKLVLDNLDAPITDEPDISSALKEADDKFFGEFDMRVEDVPDPDVVKELFSSLSVGLSDLAKASLLMRLIIMNFLGAAKLLQEQGEIIKPEALIWLTDVLETAFDYSDIAEDTAKLDEVTSELTQNIIVFFDYFSLNK